MKAVIKIEFPEVPYEVESAWRRALDEGCDPDSYAFEALRETDLWDRLEDYIECVEFFPLL